MLTRPRHVPPGAGHRSSLRSRRASRAAVSPDSFENFAEFTVRGTAFADGSDEARFNRYRDLRNGGTLDILRMTKASDSKWFNMQADHVGYRDQRFYGALNDYGKLKVSFEYNQIPLFFSETTRTLYSPTSPPSGTLRIDDGIQSGLQNGTTTIGAVDQPGAAVRSAPQAQHHRRQGAL